MPAAVSATTSPPSSARRRRGQGSQRSWSGGLLVIWTATWSVWERSPEALNRKEPHMPVGFILDFPGGTLEQYDQVLDKMALGGRMPSGGRFHAAGQTPDGIRVVDVWDSDEAFQGFAEESIGPITQEMGL